MLCEAASSYVFLACFMALTGQSAPPQSRPPEPRPPTSQAETSSGPDAMSLERIRAALKRGELGELTIFPVGLPPLPAPPPVVPISRESVATFRVEIAVPRMLTFEEDLKKALSEPDPAVNAGFFELYPGEHRAGAGLSAAASGGGGGVYVHPSALVNWAPRLLRKRAVARARQQVEAELQALLAAQRDAEKGGKEQK